MSDINRLLRDEAVDLNAHASTWQEAISHAGQLLESTGAITDEYTRAMVESVEANGPYIVLAPGFAFAHARPSEAVRETALAWTRLDTPVEFGHKSNDPVNLVVALAAKDDKAHTAAMKELAGIVGNPRKREELDRVSTVAELREILEGKPAARNAAPAAAAADNSTRAAAAEKTDEKTDEKTVESKGKILTVCGNGLGTSLFLKNTLDKVLDSWGWGPYVSVEATDTISAKGRANEADFILTSGEIARTLGDVGVPVRVIENFTSEGEIDSALRELYAV